MPPEDRTLWSECARCGHESPVSLTWRVRGRREDWCPTCSKLVLDGLLPADREAKPSKGPLFSYPKKEEG